MKLKNLHFDILIFLHISLLLCPISCTYLFAPIYSSGLVSSLPFSYIRTYFFSFIVLLSSLLSISICYSTLLHFPTCFYNAIYLLTVCNLFSSHLSPITFLILLFSISAALHSPSPFLTTLELLFYLPSFLVEKWDGCMEGVYKWVYAYSSVCL